MAWCLGKLKCQGAWDHIHYVGKVHHALDRLQERGTERGSALWSILKGLYEPTPTLILMQMQYWEIFWEMWWCTYVLSRACRISFLIELSQKEKSCGSPVQCSVKSRRVVLLLWMRVHSWTKRRHIGTHFGHDGDRNSIKGPMLYDVPITYQPCQPPESGL